MKFLKPSFIIFIILTLWQLLITLTNVPPYILPSPASVIQATISHADSIGGHAIITLIEMTSGLIIGTVLGSSSALLLSYYRPARQWLMPILVISQAVPVFAIAPILVLWLGYGMISKITMAVLIIYFPVTAAFFDGLKNTNHGYLDLSHTMGASKISTLIHIKIPAALPAFASGLRVATAMAPIGAIVGEWVGSSEGLGYLMLHANGRMQIDVMFAALLILGIMAIILFYTVDAGLRRLLFWSTEKII
jgi:putative hydroxymethylpyrimidine transport system permease protein|tara:strand:+ start:1285 stop:2031 length:747 start_codon:yes stop_codon:yes gene_type:complete